MLLAPEATSALLNAEGAGAAEAALASSASTTHAPIKASFIGF